MRPMVSAIDSFRAMMREEIGPQLRWMGFKGSGQSYLLPSGTHWILLGFQKSMYSDRRNVRFTVNVTAVSKEVWTKTRTQRSRLPERPSANSRYGPFAWQERIGQLLPDGEDRWWTIEANAPTEATAVDVLRAIRGYALPAIQKQVEAQATDPKQPGMAT